MNEMTHIYQYFHQQVVIRPDKIAVYDESRKLTYKELALLADTIRGRFPSQPKYIGIVLDHSVEMIAAILAVLKSGAAYIPAEPTLPKERIAYMMSQCNVEFVITQEEYARQLPNIKTLLLERNMPIDKESEQPPSGSLTANSNAYILYTSGTTGFPKGVMVTHHNVCHYAEAFCNEFGALENDTMLQYSVNSFDIFVEEVFPILLSGGTLAIPGMKTKSDFNHLIEFIETNQVSIVTGFPYFIMEFNKLPKLPESLRLLISGGDVLRAGYVDKLVANKNVKIYNTYGPSETTVCATYFHCTGTNALPDGTYPIGKAVKGVSVQIKDQKGQAVPDGMVGEICIYGNGVSSGYIGAKNNEAFVTGQNGVRFYKSGDLGKRLPNGNIAFMKRADQQVMILGKRVEMQEVENVLNRNTLIEQAVVIANADDDGLAYISAYFVPQCKDVKICDLQDFLKRYLPEYMIPAYFINLKQFPTLPNGKVDRKSLPVVLQRGQLNRHAV